MAKINLAELKAEVLDVDDGDIHMTKAEALALIEAAAAAEAFIHFRNDLNWQDQHPSQEEDVAIALEDDKLIDAMRTALSPFTEDNE